MGGMRQPQPARTKSKGINDFAHVALAEPAPSRRCGQQRLDCRPLRICQVARVALGFALELLLPLSVFSCPRSYTTDAINYQTGSEKYTNKVLRG